MVLKGVLSFLATCTIIGWSCNINVGSSSRLKMIYGNSAKPQDSILKFNGVDGPYIVNDTIYSVSSNNELTVKPFSATDSIVVQVNNTDSFSFFLNDPPTLRKSSYDLPNKVIAISDIEGNFNAFSSFLIANKVIDRHFKWIYGSGHLVLIGDFVDRGSDVTQVLWLIYKLEQEANEAQGQVHFILGNHEIMNFQGRKSYNRDKYIKVSQEISGQTDPGNAIKFMYSEKTILGNWLRSKNIIEKIGRYIFVHGGLSPEILVHNLSLNEINEIARSNWDAQEFYNSENDPRADFIFSNKGPFWYRGLFVGTKRYNKIKPEELNRILSYYQADKIIVGHTMVNDIIAVSQGRVINIDIKHGKEKFSGQTKGLIIKSGKEFVIDDLNREKKL